MISFFPSPYPDELWYSVICRYHVHSGNYCAKHTMRQLYGDYFSAPSLLLCGHIFLQPTYPPSNCTLHYAASPLRRDMFCNLPFCWDCLSMTCCTHPMPCQTIRPR